MAKKKKADNPKHKGVRYIGRVLKKYGRKEFNVKNSEKSKEIYENILRTTGRVNVKSIMHFARTRRPSKKAKRALSIKKNFTDNIPFFHWVDFIDKPLFDYVTISLVSTKESGLGEYYAKGDKNDVIRYYDDKMHENIRELTRDRPSPVPMFRIINTDNQTFVDYNLEYGTESASLAKEGPKKEEPKKESPIKSKAGEEIELISKKIELEKAQSEKLDKIIQMRKAGYSKKEINKILGL